MRRLAVLVAASGLAANAQKIPHDLTEATLEDLMRIEVTSVSKKEQTLVSAPAAIYVITQEAIRRSGLTSIPEILRMAPGLDVARIDGNKWAISSRGFNRQFSNKMLVLLDGRSVYLASNSGVYWNEQETMVEDIDRIEVIRVRARLSGAPTPSMVSSTSSPSPPRIPREVWSPSARVMKTGP